MVALTARARAVGIERDAKNLLNRRLGDISAGRPLNPRADRVKVAELLDDLLTEYQVNERASLRRMKELVNHLRRALEHFRAAAVTTADVNRYIAERRACGAANATINRELAALKRAYSIACKATKILAKPYIPMLTENNVRTGFFERDQFEAVRAHLPSELRGLVTFAYVTGWRIPSEILTLQWRRQVDFVAGVVRLEPGTTKNREGRLFPFTPELRAVLETQWATTTDLQRRTAGSCLGYSIVAAVRLSGSMEPGGPHADPPAYPAVSLTTFVEPPSEILSAPGSHGLSR